MCGRYTLTSGPEELSSYFSISDVSHYSHPRYNISPTQMIPAVVSVDSQRRLELFRWGLIPSWAKDEKIAYSTINARAETVDTKPAFRSAFKHRRCLIPADGFYEWQDIGNPHKQPWLIVPKSGLFAFTGLWETWSGGGKAVHSCSIIVGEPNSLLSPIHDRMPIILEPEQFDTWFNDKTDTTTLKGLLQPISPTLMSAFRVGEHVNNPRNDDPTCIRPHAEQ